MSRLNHTLRLGLKELTSLRHDSVLLLFLLYAFSVAIYMPAAGSVIGVHNASVAVVAGEVAGFLTARIDLNESVPFLSKLPVCRITTVVVDEGLRSRGIGRALIAHGDQWGKARGASQLRLEVMAFNERARALYERLGFKAQSQTMAR